MDEEVAGCWQCGGIYRMYSKQTASGYDIHYCAECFAPAEPFDIFGMRLMDGEKYKAARAYASAWREVSGAIDRRI